MRKLLWVMGVVSALCASQSLANPIAISPGGEIDLYADNQGYNDLINQPGVGLVSIYVVHMWQPAGGATACQFAAPKPACFNAQWLADTAVYPVTIGNSQIGVSIGYGTCRQYPIHVLTMMFFATGPTDCCYYWVVPDPNEATGNVLTVDCSFEPVAVHGGATIINYAPGCGTAVEDKTWGQVKVLYAE
jgi:hypothetical protein